MKEETKNRLRKFGKVTAYGFGLFAMLLLGVGLGNCSAKDKSAKANAETGFSFVEHKLLQPKRVLDPANFRTLSLDEDNLLFDAEAGHYDVQSDAEAGGLRFPANGNRDMYLLPLNVGTYVLDYKGNSANWRGSAMLINSYGAIQVRKAFNGEPYNRVLLQYADREESSAVNLVGGERRIMFSPHDEFTYLLLYCANNVNFGVKVSFFDWEKAPALATYDFPVLFNPYPLGGSPATSDFIFNGPAVSEGTIVQTQTLAFNGVTFRSNGKLYDRIILAYKHDINQTFGHYDASGNFVLDGTLGSSAWFFDYMIYAYGSDYSDVAWNAKFENVDSNLAWKPALVSGGLWIAQEYRHIEVISFDGASLSGLPATSLVLNSSVESVLKLISSYVAPSTSEMGNPFTLIREGFSAVGGILSINILPFMTLGTLIFVPLVVLVILAILKLLAK